MSYRKSFKPRGSCARHADREQKIKDKFMLLGLLCHSSERAFNKALRINEKSLEGSQAACAFKNFRHILEVCYSHVFERDDSGPPISHALDTALGEQHFRDSIVVKYMSFLMIAGFHSLLGLTQPSILVIII